MTKAAWIVAAGLMALSFGWTSTAQAKPTKCHLHYSLKGWAVIYESANGTGTITCDNGQSAEVVLKSAGGGVAFGEEKVLAGDGAFSEVNDISDLFGHYAGLAADAGSGKAADSRVLSNGKITLALAGKGEGVEVGISFGDLDIQKAP